MTTHSDVFSDKKDRPLTRSDVEKLLVEVGSSDKLDLTSRNLSDIDLSNFSLEKAHLTGARLREADLTGADLTRADLTGADLTRADLTRADLTGARLSGASLLGADLSKTNLSGADLTGAVLLGARLSGASLLGVNLSKTHLSGVVLSGTDLYKANLIGANFSAILISHEDIPAFVENLKVRVNASEKSDAQGTATGTTFDIRLQVNEEPLTAQNFASIISAFTELHTKCWLIAHGRFADLIEYTQTHNERFAKEANLVIVKMTHNSPADIRVNVNADASVQGLAEALKTGIDAITQAPHRRKATELENQATELAIKQKKLEARTTQAERAQNLQIAAQQAEINWQKGLLELQQQQIQVAKEQVGLDRERLALEKNRLEFALETASKMVDMLHPGIDAQTKAMLLQTLIPNLLQTANGQGIVIALPEPKKEETK